MAQHRFLLAFLVVMIGALLASDSHPARACSCFAVEPDVAYQQAFLVFTGTVQKVTDLTRPAAQDDKPVLAYEGRLTCFKVEEYFKGTGGPQVELRGGNTSCDIGFEAEKRYLVYASQNAITGALGAFSCSRTALLDDYTKPDISYLRRAARGERPTMLYGFAYRSAWTYSKRGESEPFGDLTITVEGEGKRLDLKTDPSGYFETFELPPGSYRVHTGVTGKLRGAEEKSVELKSDGVASMTFRTTSMGSLRGRIIDREGSPVNEIHVELLPERSLPGALPLTDYVASGEDGRFTFAEVPAGRYTVAVNSQGHPSLYGAPFMPSYFPNAASSEDAQAITIADGVSLEIGDFALQPRYPTVAITGVVVTLDGKPVPDAFVNLEKVGRPWDAARSVQTDAAGHFVHQAFEKVTYTIRASADGPNGGILESDRVEVTAAKSAVPVRLVVKQPR